MTSDITVRLQISEANITGVHKPFPIFKSAPCLKDATQCTKDTLGLACTPACTTVMLTKPEAF